MQVNIKKNFAAATLLLCLALAAIQKDNVSLARILHPLNSQEVTLNKNATFHCITEQTDAAEWLINNTYQFVNSVPPLLSQRGFMVELSIRNNMHNSTLIVHASLQNNNTEIICRLTSSSENRTARLTILGPPDPPVNLSVAILQYSPTIVQFRWLAPYAPHGHSVLYYTVFINSRSIASVADNRTALSHVESNVTEICNVNFTVTASNDVAESEPTLFTTSILKVPNVFGFEVEAEIRHCDDVPVITLYIQFPELCPLQQMNYTVTLVNVATGDLMHLLFKTMEYTGAIVKDTIPLHSVQRGMVYYVVVHLETATGSASSKSSYIYCNVSAQNVVVESLSRQPACPNELLVYSCQVDFPALVITWRHAAFGSLGFTAVVEEEGSTMTSSDGRVVASLTMNEGTMTHRMLASTLTIQPPLNNLNGTTLTCEAQSISVGTRSGTDIIILAVCRCEEESKEESFSAGTALGIAITLTLLLALPLGILIGCCGSWYRRQATGDGTGKSQQPVSAIYEEPGPVEAAIPLSENLAYGHVQRQRRN